MKIKYLRKLNKSGFSHIEIALIIVLIIGLGGVYALVKGHADTISLATGVASTPKITPDTPYFVSASGKATASESHTSGSCTILNGFCYFWSYEEKIDSSGKMTGASATISVDQPKIDPKDTTSAHSLGELYDGNNQSYYGTYDAVEIGWIVYKGIFHDSLTHLFVYHWVNGQATCYDGCGFVQSSTVYKPGMVLKPGTTAILSSQFLINKWWLLYNGVRVGYFPEQLWGGLFENPDFAEAYGEVASGLNAPVTQMGDGIYAGKANASTITNFSLLNSTSSNINYASTAPTAYGNVPIKPPAGVQNELSFGGPGF